MKVAVCLACGAMTEYNENGQYFHNCPNPTWIPVSSGKINAFKIIDLLTLDELAEIFKKMGGKS